MLLHAPPPRADAAQLGELAAHLRLSDAYDQDDALLRLLASCAEAATLRLESLLNEVLLRRRFAARVEDWNSGLIALPTFPVETLVSVTCQSASGQRTVLPAGLFRIERFRRPQCLAANEQTALPVIEQGGFAELVWDAGRAAHWNELSPDIRMAGAAVATAFFDQGPEAATPPLALSLLSPYRSIRL